MSEPKKVTTRPLRQGGRTVVGKPPTPATKQPEPTPEPAEENEGD